VKLLDDKNDFVCTAAAEALAHIGDAAAVKPLMQQVTNRKEPHMKAACLWAVATIGGDAARTQLEPFLKSNDGTLRACAIGGIVKIDGKKSVAMLRTLRTDAEKDVRLFAARKLAEFGDASFLAEMAKMAKDNEASFRDRADALDVIGKSGKAEAAEAIAPLLADETKYGYPFGRDAMSARAALALYRLGDPRGIDYLAKAAMLGGERSKAHLAWGATKLLAKVKRDDALPILMKALDVRRTQTVPAILDALWAITGIDPGADIDVVGWRRPGLDAKRWREWWDKQQADD
jgi:HEAT repeat protein